MLFYSMKLSGKKKKKKLLFQNERRRDFSGGPVVKNPLASAGGLGLIPGLGRSHMPWSPCTTTPEPGSCS